jgi:hypothetical protein
LTDDRKWWHVTADLYYGHDAAGGWTAGTGIYTSFKPSSSVRLRVGPWVEHARPTAQYVQRQPDSLATATYGNRYVFSALEQTNLSVSTRLDWTFSPRVSLQLYGQVFVGSGHFFDYKEFETPRTFDFAVYGKDRGTISRDSEGDFLVDPDGDGPAESFTIYNPDFNSRSLRSTVVLRWEYRSGSTIYLAWQHRRSDYEQVGDFSLRRDLPTLFSAEGRNVLVLKATYWLGL